MATEQLQQNAETAREIFLAPAQELTSLHLDFLGKAANIHLDAIRKLTDLGLKNARAVLEIRDPQGLQQFIQGQTEAASTFSNQVQEDTRKLMDLGQDYARRAGAVAQNRIPGAGNTA